MRLVLGIDTGGTYTDGVIFNIDTQEIITKAKALTSHDNLSIGISNCIKELNITNPKEIKFVSLSTTLATNAIVEGRGGEVGLLLIGNEPKGKLPIHQYEVLNGGHDVKGILQQDLDMIQVNSAISRLKGKVDAIAVSGYFSIRNPEHELKIRDIVHQSLGIPVVCAHQLTRSLGFYERTVTAVLNAKLISIIADLIKSVKLSLHEVGIDSTLMVVKGDGTLMSEDVVLQKPIETILSGPAASIIGAKEMTDISDALILDMGGTTTDIAILQNGVPRINPEGALIGGWRTRVEAADVNTYGLGGDSYIKLNFDNELEIGPKRVIPLSVAACNYPYLINELELQKQISKERYSFQNADCFMLLKNSFPEKLDELEQDIVQLLDDGPHSMLYLSNRLKKRYCLTTLKHLVNTGVLAKISLTPTDILHAKGTYTFWNTDAALMGTEILAYAMGKSVEDFIELSMNNIIDNLCKSVLQSLCNFEGSSIDIKDKQTSYFINKMLKSEQKNVFGCKAIMNIPIIGIGAPVWSYLPKVAEKLNTKLIIPDNAEVANAVGTAAGKVMEKIKILITSSQQGGFIVHAPWERKEFKELEYAKKYAVAEIKKHASMQVEKAGAMDYQVVLNSEDKYIEMNPKWDEKIYLETLIEATAVGHPKWQ